MKKTIYGVLAFAALTFTACGGGENTEETAKNEEEAPKEEVVEEVVAEYNLNKEESKLEWNGSWIGGNNDGNTHNGVVQISEGKMSQKGEDYSGHFTVDMTTVDVQDIGEADGKPKLQKHLASPEFFNIEEYSVTEVKVKEIVDGNAEITMNIAGNELEKSVPVEVNTDENTMTIKGDFTISVEDLEMEGMQVDPEKPEEGSVSSELGFKLHAVLDKQ